MKTSRIRKILFTTLGFSSSILLNLNTPSFAQALVTLPELSNINSSISTSQVQPKKTDLQWVYSVAEKVIRANGLDDHPWRFEVSDKYDINAYAGELNKIVIYKGLLDQIHGDDAALAFIISHELAHHTQRHAVQRIELKSSLEDKLLKQADEELTNWIVAEKQKSDKPISTAKKDVIRQRIMLQKQQELDNALQALSRQQEFQADEVGYKYMSTAGYDDNGGLRVFKLLSRLPSDYTANSSHPPTQQRIDAFNGVISEYPWLTLWVDGNERLKINSQPLTFDVIEDEISVRINSRFVSK